VIPLAEAQAHVLAHVAPLTPRRVPLPEAGGLVLAEAVRSPEAVPPFANTAMDGYAVVAADVAGASAAAPVRLPVVAEVAAGHPATRPLAPGQAMRIFTGAPIPEGADAIVIVEHTERADDGATVVVREPTEAGRHIRPAGDDLQPGDDVFAPGEALTAGHLGVLAGIGVTGVLVVPRPRVGVFSTGDELVPAGEPLGPGQIRDSNRLALLVLLRDAGMEAVDLGLVRDDEDAIAAAVATGVASCDAVLTSGGVSMGDLDLVKVVLDRVGDMRWMQIAIRPAKPFAFGMVGERAVPVFGLPGNPVSSMVSFELLAHPALRRMAGHARVHRPAVPAVAEEPFPRRPDGRTAFVRVAARRAEDGTLLVRSAGAQGSHHLTAMARAHALLVLEDGPGVEAGAPVEVLLLHEP
jgi:molybdenum cofactor synthesis domain-containing protein